MSGRQEHCVGFFLSANSSSLSSSASARGDHSVRRGTGGTVPPPSESYFTIITSVSQQDALFLRRCHCGMDSNCF